MALPIEDYALIGDRHTAALVGRDGSIDWLCLPRFDSPACFAGAARRPSDHGRWQLGPVDEYDVDPALRRRLARVLETTFTTDTGAVPLLDLMPTGDDRADVVRRITGVSGHGADAPRVGRALRLRPGPPLGAPRARLDGEEVITAVAGPDQLMLRGPRLPRPSTAATLDEFDVDEGEVLTFSTTWVAVVRDAARADRLGRPDRGDPCRRGGVGRAVQPRRPARRRSCAARLLTLRLLTHERDRRHRRRPHHVACRRTSAASATGTTATAGCATPRSPWSRCSPPATPRRRGRGATGCCARWPATREDLQIMYAVDGGRQLPERELDHLPGYAGSPAGPDRQRRGRRSGRPTSSAR